MGSESGSGLFSRRKEPKPPFGNVVAGPEDIPWATLKHVWSKGPAVLWAQTNLQLQPQM